MSPISRKPKPKKSVGPFTNAEVMKGIEYKWKGIWTKIRNYAQAEVKLTFQAYREEISKEIHGRIVEAFYEWEQKRSKVGRHVNISLQGEWSDGEIREISGEIERALSGCILPVPPSSINVSVSDPRRG